MFDLMRAWCACEHRELCRHYLAERHLRAEERSKVYLPPQCFSSIYAEKDCSACHHGKNLPSCESQAGAGPGALSRATFVAPYPMLPAGLHHHPQLWVLSLP